ncbi:MFS transporter [Bifidobacterium cuniculi]|uniref:Na+/sugar symporter n=1 Tax=Bifidobacterium cuniculi TaxID=1688 RepID=A0A087B3B5_9BIFI|nr:MFS transporter [Bifidobacterium cuniculi]KFI65515.1 Na+/sugar symporter [Bifidobacterium cuniculi]
MTNQNQPGTEPTPEGAPQQPPRPFPNQDFIRPGIDDRPDWDTALSDEDMEAVQRLAVRQKPQVAPDAAAQPEVQAAALENTPAVHDDPLPDAESAFLDLRDPMVDASGYRPTHVEVVRMKTGFALTSFFLSFALCALNLVLVPERLDQMVGGFDGTTDLAWLIAIGVAVTILSTAVMLPVSDRTRTKYGRRAPWFLGGAVVAVLLTSALAASRTDVTLTVAWAFLQLGFAAMQFALFASIGERVPDKFRDAVALWRKVGWGAGLLAGVVVAALCMDAAAGGIEICAGAVALAAVCMLLVVPREHSSSYLRITPMATSDMTTILRVPGAPRAWLVATLARLLASAAVTVPLAFVWFIVKYVHGFDAPLDLRMTMLAVVAMAVVAYVCMAIATVVLRPVMAKWEDDVRAPAIAACVISVLAVACPLLMPSATGLMLFAALFAFSTTMLQDLAQSLATSVIERTSERGAYLAVLNTADSGGKLIGALAGGVTVLCAGATQPLFIVSGVLAILTIVCVAFVRQR